jgi:hypothetical protein
MEFSPRYPILLERAQQQLTLQSARDLRDAARKAFGVSRGYAMSVTENELLDMFRTRGWRRLFGAERA